jgi:hypothetical protein
MSTLDEIKPSAKGTRPANLTGPSSGRSGVPHRFRVAYDATDIDSENPVSCRRGLCGLRAPGRVGVPAPSARFRLMEHNPTPPVSLSSPARTRLASRPLLLSHG